jgi:hypothetical protein
VLPARIFFIFFISNAPLYYHNVVELKLSLSRGFYVFFIWFFCDYKIWSGVIWFLNIYKILINLKKVNCTWHSHGHSHNVVMQLKSSFHDGILFLMTLPPLIGGAFVPKKYWVFIWCLMVVILSTLLLDFKAFCFQSLLLYIFRTAF